ncbi:MAG: malate dehydrogenase (quinone) [Bacteroidota bacterium]
MSRSLRPVEPQSDVVLMGAGIMSATLGILLKELDPSISIQVFERLEQPGLESSDAWNNAGTGHAAFCELNYTPQAADGTVSIGKAVKISQAYEQSRELWAYLTERGITGNPGDFISTVPHISLVWGEENVKFLETRFNAMRGSALFSEMTYTTNRAEISQWAPLVMEGRTESQPVAATRMDCGTDVNFGTLTRRIMNHLGSLPGVTIHYDMEALDLDPDGKGGWDVSVKSLLSEQVSNTNTRFVFIGAGGATLHLLKRAEIEERKGYGGFPVGGLWLKCNNPAIAERHHAKVYGKATVGSPPMSVPHIDTRFINGKKELLFGPFAGFSTRFLKNGSLLDLPRSIRADNAIPMIVAGINNIPLTRYLIEQLRLSPEDRLESLREYVPTAKLEDWELLEAGQRVQVIKKDKKAGGVLEFGTELVVSSDGTVAALLGASPGASTAATVMLDLIRKCFPDRWKNSWHQQANMIFPSLETDLSSNEQALEATRSRTARLLNLSSTTR